MKNQKSRPGEKNMPFVLVFSKKSFDKLEGQKSEGTLMNGRERPRNHVLKDKKEEIVVPKIQIVQRITKPKNFSKIGPDYLRLTNQLNLPKEENYQPTEVDHFFIQEHSQKFLCGGKKVLTPQFLSAAFIALEKKAGRDWLIPREATWMKNFVEENNKELITMPNYEQFISTFYYYWKNRREELQFPLLRSLWRPNPDQYSYFLAFKRRDSDRINLRRNVRNVGTEMVQELQKQFSHVLKMIERIKLREELKTKQFELTYLSFHSPYKHLFPEQPDVSMFTSYSAQSRAKDHEKIKAFRRQIQMADQKEQDEQIEEEQEEEEQSIRAQITKYDEKASILNFLSTVIYYAETQRIHSDRVFHGRPGNLVRNRNISSSYSQPDRNIFREQLSSEKKDCLQFALYQQIDTLYRTFEQAQSQSSDNSVNAQMKSRLRNAPKDLFEYYQKQMACYSFGEDYDDGQDIRKKISQSFKQYKYLMRE